MKARVGPPGPGLFRAMQVVHTFWSRPEAERIRSRDHRAVMQQRFGCASPRDHWSFWALSNHLMRKHYGDDTMLLTDRIGAKILVEELGLHYGCVSTALEDCPFYGSHLWAVGKIFGYGTHDRPFFNIDGDLFLWRRLADVHGKPLFAQSFETPQYHEFYKTTMDFLEDHVKGLTFDRSVAGYNVGIIGGTDLETIKVYSRRGMAFLDQYAKEIERLKDMVPGAKGARYLQYNILVEQHLLAIVAKERGVKVHTFVRDDWWNMTKAEQKKLPFSHLLGPSKTKSTVVARVYERLKKAEPETMARLMAA